MNSCQSFSYLKKKKKKVNESKRNKICKQRESHFTESCSFKSWKGSSKLYGYCRKGSNAIFSTVKNPLPGLSPDIFHPPNKKCTVLPPGYFTRRTPASFHLSVSSVGCANFHTRILKFSKVHVCSEKTLKISNQHFSSFGFIIPYLWCAWNKTRRIASHTWNTNNLRLKHQMPFEWFPVCSPLWAKSTAFISVPDKHLHNGCHSKTGTGNY